MNLKKIALIVVIVIIVSIVIIAGINYMKKKQVSKSQQAPRLTSEVIDTTGMGTYVITFPFSYQSKYGEYLDAIKEAKYSFDKEYVTNDDKGGPKDINIQIKTLSKDIQGVTDILTKLNQEIKVQEIKP